uniref:Uncharacterized protein n=1 Tax=Arundo donax TaxID=35708 RepID=A0A0A8ZE79_ARUDO
MFWKDDNGFNPSEKSRREGNTSDLVHLFFVSKCIWSFL